MRKIIFLFLSILFASGALLAENDTIIIKNSRSGEIIERSLDSLLNNWYLARLAAASQHENKGEMPVTEFPDSVYRARIESINSVIPLPYNSIVRNHIHVYTGKKRDRFEIMLGMREYYFPMIEDIFDSYGLPAELKYMAVIESALNPNAVSRVGATGLWQFMYSTGRHYGLTINSVVDERRDPVKATHAAARYLQDLHDIYGDWGLVIAAYNCGPGNVNKAIRRSGNRKDYWEIYYRLPRETRGYLPAYIAATYAMNFYEHHNIVPAKVSFPLATDTIMVSEDIHLGQVSEVLKVPYEELRTLNPQYRASIVPGSSKPMALTLPVNELGNFISLKDSISGYRADHYLKTSGKTASPVRSAYIPPAIKGKTKLIYTVKEGDNLGYIASWYNVGLSSLRYWNNIYRNTIRIGQKISVYVDPSKKDYYAVVDKLSFAEKQARIGKKVAIVSKQVSSTSSVPDDDYIYHTVKPGDTVWDIAKRYEGVTTSQILTLNGMSSNTKIKVGQVLKIRRKS